MNMEQGYSAKVKEIFRSSKKKQFGCRFLETYLKIFFKSFPH